MARNEGGLPLERRLGISKICGVLPGLAGIEVVGGRKGAGCIAELRVFFLGLMIRRRSFVMLFFYSSLRGFVFHFGASCGVIMVFRKETTCSSGPSWRILGASWAHLGRILGASSGCSNATTRLNKTKMVLLMVCPPFLAWKRILPKVKHN